MKKSKNNIHKSLYKVIEFSRLLGFDPQQAYHLATRLPRFIMDLYRYRKQVNINDRIFPIKKIYPILTDKESLSGISKGHYFHQDLLVARKIFHNNPEIHVDIGSRIDGFVAHVATFREITVLDIRKQHAKLENINFVECDIVSEISESWFNYCDSLSCLHAIEHFGLGRYGDKINKDGHLIGLKNMTRILRNNGKFYFSAPIGPQRIEFNRHRVFSLSYLLEIFDKNYYLDSLSIVDDNGDLFKNVTFTQSDVDVNYNCSYGCAIFELTKK